MASQEKYELSEEINFQIRNLQNLYNKLKWYQFKKKKEFKSLLNEYKEKFTKALNTLLIKIENLLNSEDLI